MYACERLLVRGESGSRTTLSPAPSGDLAFSNLQGRSLGGEVLGPADAGRVRWRDPKESWSPRNHASASEPPERYGQDQAMPRGSWKLLGAPGLSDKKTMTRLARTSSRTYVGKVPKARFWHCSLAALQRAVPCRAATASEETSASLGKKKSKLEMSRWDDVETREQIRDVDEIPHPSALNAAGGETSPAFFPRSLKARLAATLRPCFAAFLARTRWRTRGRRRADARESVQRPRADAAHDQRCTSTFLARMPSHIAARTSEISIPNPHPSALNAAGGETSPAFFPRSLKARLAATLRPCFAAFLARTRWRTRGRRRADARESVQRPRADAAHDQRCTSTFLARMPSHIAARTSEISIPKSSRPKPSQAIPISIAIPATRLGPTSLTRPVAPKLPFSASLKSVGHGKARRRREAVGGQGANVQNLTSRAAKLRLPVTRGFPFPPPLLRTREMGRDGVRGSETVHIVHDARAAADRGRRTWDCFRNVGFWGKGRRGEREGGDAKLPGCRSADSTVVVLVGSRDFACVDTLQNTSSKPPLDAAEVRRKLKLGRAGMIC
nr:hypothetical protein CFP56_58191 [Quercus suber]